MAGLPPAAMLHGDQHYTKSMEQTCSTCWALPRSTLRGMTWRRVSP